jgi:hypothetical protein
MRRDSGVGRWEFEELCYWPYDDHNDALWAQDQQRSVAERTQ